MDYDSDGLTEGTVVGADPATNRYLVDVGDDCVIRCSLQWQADELVLVELADGVRW